MKKAILIALAGVASLADNVNAEDFGDNPWTGNDKITALIKDDQAQDKLIAAEDKKVADATEKKKKLDKKAADLKTKIADLTKKEAAEKDADAKKKLTAEKDAATKEEAAAKKEIDAEQKIIDGAAKTKKPFEDKIKANDAELTKLNPGLATGTRDAVAARLSAGHRIFMLSEVLGTSALRGFEAFSTKLGAQITTWGELEKADEASLKAAKAKDQTKAANKAEVKAYEDAEKANKMAIKAVTDYKKFVDESVVKTWKKAVTDKAKYEFPTSDFDVARAQYRDAYLAATVGEAQSLIELYTGNQAKKTEFDGITKYLVTLKKEEVESKTKLEEARKAATGGLMWLYGLLAAAAGGVGVYCIWKKCKAKGGSEE